MIGNPKFQAVNFCSLSLVLLLLELVNGEYDTTRKNIVIDYHSYPQYSYSYGVNDFQNRDFKDAYETRDGNFVHGRYSVLQPDGILRVVTYTSDPWNGFQAKVSMLNGYSQHPIPKATKSIAIAKKKRTSNYLTKPIRVSNAEYYTEKEYFRRPEHLTPSYKHNAYEQRRKFRANPNKYNHFYPEYTDSNS